MAPASLNWGTAPALDAFETLMWRLDTFWMARFGERGVVDLISVNGYYSLVSMCLNVDRTPVPDGAPLPLPPLAK